MTQVIALRDGALLAYDSSDFTDPWTQPSSVVLVHGFSKNRMFWNAWMPALARYHRVIRVDLRGHGQSSVPPEKAELKLSTFVDDLIEFLDRVGVHSAHFVMAEFASSIAIELGSAIPYRTKSLTMPGFGFDWRDAPVDWSEWSRLAREEGALAWAEQTSHYRMHRDTNPQLRQWYVEQQGRMPGWLLAKVFDLCARLDLSDRLPLIEAPTLVINGSDGKQAPIDNVRDGVIAMRDARLCVLQGQPFNVMTTAPEDCVQLTLAFLREIDGHPDLAPEGR